MIKIGVFGGSFDPIHRSHVRVIEESIRQLKLDKILVMPTANNPWKDSTSVIFYDGNGSSKFIS